MTQATIAEFLSALLVEKRVNQRQLAAYIDASPAAVNDWVLGKRIPDPKWCWALADYAGEEIEHVMRLAGHLPPASKPREVTIIPAVRDLLSEMTAAEQREAALPALEVVERLLRRGQAGSQ